RMATSNGSPASIRRLRSGEKAYSTTSLRPVMRSKTGLISFKTLRGAALLRPFSSAGCAATSRDSANAISKPTIAAAVFAIEICVPMNFEPKRSLLGIHPDQKGPEAIDVLETVRHAWRHVEHVARLEWLFRAALDHAARDIVRIRAFFGIEEF